MRLFSTTVYRWLGAMDSRYSVATIQHQRSLWSSVHEICRSAIDGVSSHQLVCRNVAVVEGEGGGGSAVMCVGGREYTLHNNVKVVAFGKAVLGMVEALEGLLGSHLIGGVASVPVGSLSQHRKIEKIKVLEGASNNLPDSSAEKAARKILDLCHGAEVSEIVMALISGGGSALLPCPLDGVQLDEKRKMIEMLSKAGASIHELNTFRKYLSKTKGGRLAEAAYPAQMVALILSDVVGDPLDVIASGPTVPSPHTTHSDIIALVDKYNLLESIPASIQALLAESKSTSTSNQLNATTVNVPIGSDGSYEHVLNVIVGSNKIATSSAEAKARSMSYNTIVWSHAIEGEARLVGEVYALITHSIAMKTLTFTDLQKQSCFVELTHENPIMLKDFEKLVELLDKLESCCDLCLISGGEPTVTVMGDGRGGRNQELALAFSLKYAQLEEEAHESQSSDVDCVLMSVGTDGQDGPTDAAGAIGHYSIPPIATRQGMDAEEFLRRNDSYSFFAQLEEGKYHVKTGLTGTNVMDIHCILFHKK